MLLIIRAGFILDPKSQGWMRARFTRCVNIGVSVTTTPLETVATFSQAVSRTGSSLYSAWRAFEFFHKNHFLVDKN